MKMRVTASRSAPIVLLLALLLRAGIPAGYMLAPGGALPRIVPCSGVAANSRHGHHGNRSDQTPCAFAVVAQAASPGAPPLIAPALRSFPPPFVPRARQASPRLPDSLRPPTTGPPSA
jgi:hypothetical protein